MAEFVAIDRDQWIALRVLAESAACALTVGAQWERMQPIIRALREIRPVGLEIVSITAAPADPQLFAHLQEVEGNSRS